MNVTIRISGAVALAALLTFGLAAQQAAGDAVAPRESVEAPGHQERDGDLRQRQAALRADRHRGPGRTDFLYRQRLGHRVERLTVRPTR